MRIVSVAICGVNYADDLRDHAISYFPEKAKRLQLRQVSKLSLSSLGRLESQLPRYLHVKRDEVLELGGDLDNLASIEILHSRKRTQTIFSRRLAFFPFISKETLPQGILGNSCGYLAWLFLCFRGSTGTRAPTYTFTGKWFISNSSLTQNFSGADYS